MRLYKFWISLTLLTMMLFFVVSFNNPPQEKWVAPKGTNEIINPLKNDLDATVSGKKLFKVFCSVCHGTKGKGDGIAGTGLKPNPTNFTTKEFQSQTDGAIYWKIETGRTPMASYKESIPEKNRWEIINYLRTLKK